MELLVTLGRFGAEAGSHHLKLARGRLCASHSIFRDVTAARHSSQATAASDCDSSVPANMPALYPFHAASDDSPLLTGEPETWTTNVYGC